MSANGPITRTKSQLSISTMTRKPPTQSIKPSTNQSTNQPDKSSANQPTNQSKPAAKSKSAGKRKDHDADQSHIDFFPSKPDDIIALDDDLPTPEMNTIITPTDSADQSSLHPTANNVQPNSEATNQSVHNDHVIDDQLDHDSGCKEFDHPNDQSHDSNDDNPSTERLTTNHQSNSSLQPAQSSTPSSQSSAPATKRITIIDIDDEEDASDHREQPDLNQPMPQQMNKSSIAQTTNNHAASHSSNQPSKQNANHDKQPEINQALHQAAINQVNSSQQSYQRTDIITLPRTKPNHQPTSSTDHSSNPNQSSAPTPIMHDSNQSTVPTPTVRDFDERKLYTISYEMAQKLGAHTDEFEKSFELVIASRNKIGDRFLDLLELLSVTKNLDAARIAETLGTIFNLPFFPTALLENGDLNSFINNPSITHDLAQWANVLHSASSFDDTNLLNLPISLPTQPDVPAITKIGELFDDRTACWTSFTREKRDNTVRIRLVFKSRPAMLVFGALVQRFATCTTDPFVVNLAEKHKVLLAQPSVFASKEPSRTRSLSIDQAFVCLRTTILGENQETNLELQNFLHQPVIALSLNLQMYKPNSRFTTAVLRGLARAPASSGGHLYIPRLDNVIPNQSEALEQINRMVRWNHNLRALDTVISLPHPDQRFRQQNGDVNITLRAVRVSLLKWGLKFQQVRHSQREWDVSNLSVMIHLKGANLCFSCHQAGHLAASCPLNIAQANKSLPATPICPRCFKPNELGHNCLAITDVMCTLCNQTGHFTNQCLKARRTWAQLVKPNPTSTSVSPATITNPNATNPLPDTSRPAELSNVSPDSFPPLSTQPPDEMGKQEKFIETITKLFELHQQSQRQVLEAQAAMNAQIMAQMAAMNQSIVALTQACMSINQQKNQPISVQSSYPTGSPCTITQLPPLNPPGIILAPPAMPANTMPSFNPSPVSLPMHGTPGISQSQQPVQIPYLCPTTSTSLSYQPHQTSQSPTTSMQTQPQAQSRNTTMLSMASGPTASPQLAIPPNIEQAVANFVSHLLQSVQSALTSTTMTTLYEL